MKFANGFRLGGRLSLRDNNNKKALAAAALLGLAIAGPAALIGGRMVAPAEEGTMIDLGTISVDIPVE
jgi:hypothetical protein